VSKDGFDVITVWGGRDSATYLAEDFMKDGDKAKPLWVNQYPGVNTPFHELKMEDIDGLIKHTLVTKEDLETDRGHWDLKALKILTDAKGKK